MYMRKFMVFALAAVFACGCGTKASHRLISPLPSGIEIAALTDCTVPASFTSDDFRWMGGNLTMKVFSEDLYDAVELLQMAPGDTIFFDGENIVVENIDSKEGFISVNGGIEEGGAWLQSGDGGTYRACQWDDHSIYSELGTVELPLSEDFMIVDCGENPTDPSDTLTVGQKLYLETLEGPHRIFSPLNTRVLVEDGIITKIVRFWIP